MSMMPQHHYKGSSSDYVAGGAAFAVKPKDGKFTAPRNSPSNRIAESPKEIKALVSKLPGGGEKIRRQLSELDEKLTSAEEKKGATEVICLDD